MSRELTVDKSAHVNRVNSTQKCTCQQIGQYTKVHISTELTIHKSAHINRVDSTQRSTFQFCWQYTKVHPQFANFQTVHRRMQSVLWIFRDQINNSTRVESCFVHMHLFPDSLSAIEINCSLFMLELFPASFSCCNFFKLSQSSLRSDDNHFVFDVFYVLVHWF